MTISNPHRKAENALTDTPADPATRGVDPDTESRHRVAFRRLVVSRSISFLGDSVTLVALLLHVADNAGQAFAVAALLLAGDFVPALFAPVAGAISDRFDLRRVMVTCEVVQAAAVATIALTMPALPWLLLLVGVRAVASQIFQPASRTAVPALVPDRQLESANATLGFGANGMEALGPLLAAGLLPWVGVRGMLLADAATFLVSAALLACLPPLPAVSRHSPNDAGGEHPRARLLSEARSGLAYMSRARVVRIIALGFIGVVAFNGVDDIAVIYLTRDSLHAGGSAIALLYGAVGVGLLMGYIMLARWTPRCSMEVLLLSGFALSSLGNFLTGFAWAVSTAFALQAARGIGLSAIDVGVNTLLQRQVPAEMLGRVFGNLYGAIGVAAAASYLSGALLLELTEARTTFVVAGLGGLLVTIVTASALRRSSRRGDTTAQT